MELARFPRAWRARPEPGFRCVQCVRLSIFPSSISPHHRVAPYPGTYNRVHDATPVPTPSQAQFAGQSPQLPPWTGAIGPVRRGPSAGAVDRAIFTMATPPCGT